MNNTEWDKRAWLLAFGGGNLCGLLYLLGDVTVRHKTTVGVGFMFLTACLLETAFVLPGWLAVMAKRCYLLWGVLPQTIVLLWVWTTTIIRGERLPVGFNVTSVISYVILSICLVIPICLYRFVQRREAILIAMREQSVRNAYEHAMQEAQISREGVWPPPPRSSPE